MMLMRFGGLGGLGRLGAVDWSTMCVSTQPDPDDPSHFVDCLDANGNVIDSRSFTTGGTATTPTDSSSQPWWSTALTALVKGTTSAIVGGANQPAPNPVTTPTPWYSTPVGMIGILAAILGGGYLFFKK